MANDPPYIDEPPNTPAAKTPAPKSSTPLSDHHVSEIRPPRSYGEKVFGIPWTGWVHLTFLSLVVGVLISLSQINVFEPGFTLGGAFRQLIDGVLRGLGWLLSRGWQPLLIGAAVVAPIWIAWRAVSALWRK